MDLFKSKGNTVQDEAEKTIHWAQQAETIMGMEAWNLSMEALRQHYVAVWQNSLPSDTEVREEAYRSLKNLEMIQEVLAAVMQDGKVTAHRIAQEQEKAASKEARKKAHREFWEA